MYGFGGDSRENDEPFGDHSYLFSNAETLFSNTMLTPDPHPTFVKSTDTTMHDYDLLQQFEKSMPSQATNSMQFEHDLITPEHTKVEEGTTVATSNMSNIGGKPNLILSIHPSVEHQKLHNIHRSYDRTVNDHSLGLGQKDNANPIAMTPDSSKLYTDTTASEMHSRKQSVLSTDTKKQLRARSSIPPRLSWMEYGRQGILAAYSSRLSPYSLDQGEYELLRPYISRKQVTIYLNIRNGILRLWHRNPLVAVTRQEAAGCARDARHIDLSQVAFEWLLRNGYINFGCVDVSPGLAAPTKEKSRMKQKKIIIIGAGMSGLGCGRQLEALFTQLEDRFHSTGQKRPSVVILEGRKRVGGRVFSHPLKNNHGSKLPMGLRCTAEMGAQIITGFDHGNPLSFIIRGQLALRYHALRDDSVLYDADGTIVDKDRDLQLQNLWNDILDRAADFKQKQSPNLAVQGDKHLIMYGEDPKEYVEDESTALSILEESGISINEGEANIPSTNAGIPQNSAVGVEKLAGRQYNLTKTSTSTSSAQVAKNLGWSLRPSVSDEHTIDLKYTAESSKHPGLGATLDDGIRQYSKLIELTEQDLRLLNWHHANLEYANAVNVNELSLAGWDQDMGNEFEGEHTEVIGGYTQVPRGLSMLPNPLDMRFDHAVNSIAWTSEGSKKPSAVVTCDNGSKFEADEVIVTVPLGVLKSGHIKFQPSLPDWKNECVERLGFGLLNKVILVYDECFWKEDRDMFGMLNEPIDISNPSIDPLDQKSYTTSRGRFYFFWNCIKTSGKPVLIALMAGSAAHQVEQESNKSLVEDVTKRLSKVFPSKTIPFPSQVIVTRWKRDPFACGSYSYVGTKTQSGDYDIMARTCGPIHFAGEATCGTHPATVHGAYISGLRAASEIVDSLLGPIHIGSSPLVPPKAKAELTPTRSGPKRKFGYVDIWEPINKPDPFTASLIQENALDAYEYQMNEAIAAEIGPRPIKPSKGRLNPFILYTKENWATCKATCDARKIRESGNATAKASRQEIRIAIGEEWRNASDDIKRPYLEKCKDGRDTTAEALSGYEATVADWEKKAQVVRAAYMEKNKPPESYGSSRRAKGRDGLV